jgi:peptidylprolyl isomerase
MALMTSGRAAVRARAALALASVQDPAAPSVLIPALADTNAAVRRDVAFALGQSGDPAAVTPLLELLSGEGEREVRVRAIEALGKLPSMDAVAGLVALEPAAGEEVHRVLALSRLGATRGVASLEGQNLLLARLDDGEPGIRAAAAYYFGRLPDPSAWLSSVGRLRGVLDRYEKADPAAMYLVQALGRLSDARDGGRLRDWLSGAGDWRTRVNAAAAIGQLPPDPESREALIAALDDASEHVAGMAAQSLSGGNPLPSEQQRLKSWIEANPGRWRTAGPLLVLLARADEREFVFGWLDALALDDRYRWPVGLQALAYMPGVEAVERLRRAAGSEDPAIQGGAVGALAQRWSQDRFFAGNHALYFEIFTTSLREARGPQGAYAAAQVLADELFRPLGSDRVLVEAYRTMSAPAQLEPMMAILDALGSVDTPEVAALLQEEAASPEPGVRRAAHASLARLGREAQAPEPTAVDEGAAGPEAPSGPAVDWPYLASLGTRPSLTLETERGTVVLRLDPEEAPLTVQTIARLAQEGRYDGVPFHRVVPNFVIQGGDFTSGDGFGGPGFTITSEFTLLPFQRGVAGMASAGKDTEGSQFFITHVMTPHLDGAYTTFGWVVDGLDVVDLILVGDRIVRASIERGD